ncbi:MAG: FkbM family methyltransferase [Phycisphaerales bacterium]
MNGLSPYGHAHMLHRAWRYRLRTERDEVRFMLGCDLRGGLAVDIGANVGIYSYWMSKAVGREGRVIAFEPQPEMIEQLQRAKASFGMKNLTIAPTGLSSEESSATLRRKWSHLGGASISFEMPDADDELTIPLTTLDAYIDEHADRPVAFIKCDVEGHEPEVFRGAMKTLARDMPTLLFECHDSEVRGSTLFDDLGSLGYDAYFLHNGQRTHIDRFDEIRPTIAKPCLNYVCIPRTGN